MGAADKANLLTYLNRCNAVITSEIALLQKWAGDPTVPTGRQAQCNIYTRMIAGAAGASINTSINIATNLADAAVLRSPDAQHIALVAATEQSYAARSNWNGATLSDVQFTLALSTAKQNSDAAAQAGSLTLHDCTT